MSVIRGRDGSVKFDDGVVGEITNFEVTESQTSYTRNVMDGVEWDRSVGGRKSWTATIEGYYDPADAEHGGISIGQEATAEFFPEGDVSGKERRHGTGRVEERRTRHNEDGLVEFNITLKGNGELTDAAVV